MERDEILELMKLFASQTVGGRLSDPYIYKGFTYATNSVMAVRYWGELVTKTPDTIDNYNPDKLLNIFEDGKRYTKFQNIPKINIPYVSGNLTCLECKGAGHIRWKTDYNDYCEMCKTCNGKGKVDRFGLATSLDRPTTVIPGTKTAVNSVYLDLLSRLPGIKIQAENAWADKYTLRPLFLKWDFGEASLMSLSGIFDHHG